MRRIIPALLVAAIVMAGATSCNKKPKSYTIVTNTTDGKSQEEVITAANDTDALNLYLDRMSAIIVANMEKKSAPDIKSMYVLSPDGDTLNTDEGLLQAVMKKQQQADSLKKPRRMPLQRMDAH